MNLPQSLQFTSFKRYSARRLVSFWYRNYKLLFFLGFLVFLAAGGYVWYKSVHDYEWTEEQKKAYIDQHFQETSFKEAKFKVLVDKLKTRAALHEADLELSRNLFTGKPL